MDLGILISRLKNNTKCVSLLDTGYLAKRTTIHIIKEENKKRDFLKRYSEFLFLSTFYEPDNSGIKELDQTLENSVKGLEETLKTINVPEGLSSHINLSIGMVVQELTKTISDSLNNRTTYNDLRNAYIEALLTGYKTEGFTGFSEEDRNDIFRYLFKNKEEFIDYHLGMNQAGLSIIRPISDKVSNNLMTFSKGPVIINIRIPSDIIFPSTSTLDFFLYDEKAYLEQRAEEIYS